jgi:hypothetical protein
LAAKEVIAPMMEGPKNSTVDYELTKDSRLKGSSFPLQEVSICYSAPQESQFFASAQGHESNSSGGVSDLAVVARQHRHSL